MKLNVRPLERSDIPLIVRYFVDADHDYLAGMGADPEKLPSSEDWIAILEKEFAKPILKKSYYYLIWELDDTAVGHSNINNITFRASATMHLHMWHRGQRQQGLGVRFLKLCVPQYFKLFELQTLICEPYAGNPAPNHTLPKVGFKFVREYETTPGWINTHQKVRRFEMTRQQFGESYEVE